MNIQYISSRSGHVDHNYGTGKWGINETKSVPDEVGRKMVKHGDVYKLSDDEGQPVTDAATVTVNTAFDEETQRIHDEIMIMDKRQARDFVERNFGQKLDLRNFKTEASIREHALMLYNQYGLPQ